ncbi:HEAT repeat domain-containing protein [Bythopirellula goksoeyrii]|uniref:Doubled CXXCH motif (Paired_CXXCH_1) n=1 Tax=Bythopirellula goksoeyrii TaxID=1400387 RepID=A0A5B9QAS3_9BACT|nr:HEAT repeat domain-containing protein [Bythopirellula goksoeyrii]QEG33996.1 Doubled CXXCH motif (Paired_CXXCH_1) [Bythopirellula goksoeyrii]
MIFLLSARQISGLVLGCLLAGMALWCAADWYVAYPRDARPKYVGHDSCIRCHQDQQRSWQGSDHDRAMELPTNDSVLGDFDDAEFTRHGITTRFFRQDDKFMVNTEGPDGEMHDYEIKYTFGVRPLQQYMVEFDDGRLQVLTISWDSRKNEWFMVTPPDVPHERILPGDPLHWTGMAQNWNTMCAECHSTNLEKKFDLATNTYHTTYTDIDVSCETCHGPGSMHVEMAESHSLFWDRHRGFGLEDLKGATATQQVETCAPCHSRRSPLHVNLHDGETFLDHYNPSLIEPGLYYPDGQILDEVYVYGSFLQSKMYSKGVRCTDCHNPHTLELKFEGNRLCAQCHQPGKYDTPNHHHHTDLAATQCVNCHMPARTYMGVDDRRDHSLRIPRPDLSDELGTPNACTTCHTRPEETNAWAAQAIRYWYGDKRPDDPHYGPTLLAAQLGKPEGVNLIRELLRGNPPRPDIVRATAVQLLGQYGTQESDTICREHLDDESPLVRAAATQALSETSLTTFVLEVAGQLNDPIRLVRFAAARRLIGAAAQLLDPKYRESLDKAIAEYRQAQEMVLDRAASHLNLASLNHALGEELVAQEELATAIRLEPYLTGPRDQLAELLQRAGGDPAEINRLRTEEVENLTRDAKLLPKNDQIRYRQGMLLYLLGRKKEARESFEAACELRPDSYENWLALALLCENQSSWQRAYEALEKMHELRPGDPAIRGILQNIQQKEAAEKKKTEE